MSLHFLHLNVSQILIQFFTTSLSNPLTDLRTSSTTEVHGSNLQTSAVKITTRLQNLPPLPFLSTVYHSIADVAFYKAFSVPHTYQPINSHRGV